MARKPDALDLTEVHETIVDVDVASEMETSFLEYAYSVIYARALPDARDGLKPVQRRILYGMSELGLRPERPYVKSSRVVGEVMGKYHPHGDSAIYDALVRLSQDFSLRLPLVDGHGNFGSLDDGPAASRYTEARLASSSMAMTVGLDEDVVDFVPNYDGKEKQPDVLPAAIPNLLVNGAAGIAVGMATKMAPHNLIEVITAARFLLENPAATLEDVMRYIPGPDLPTGGKIVGLEGVREAYRTGTGPFRVRATARVEKVTARRQGIVITELPYLVGPEKVIRAVSEGVKAKKIVGVSSITDLTDRKHGLKIVVEVKPGFDPDAVLEQLYRTTPLEDSFNINNVALVEGQPRTLGLLELLTVWVQHRLDVVRRRCEYRLSRRQERLHLVEGLLLAILDIDEVITVIRASDDVAAARTRLMTAFDLSEVQAQYILELRLARLTKFSRLELEAERDSLAAEIASLQEILGSDALLRSMVSDEMAEVAAEYGTPRRTVLLDAAGAGVGAASLPGAAGSAGLLGGGNGKGKKAALSLEIADEPTHVLLSATGLVARANLDAATPSAGTVNMSPARAEGESQDLLGNDGADALFDVTETRHPADAAGVSQDPSSPTPPRAGRRQAHDALLGDTPTTTRSEVGLVTSAGRVLRISVLDLPALPPTDGAPSLAGGVPVQELVALDKDEQALAIISLADDAPTLALGTAQGVVKRVAPGDIPNKDEWEVIALKDDDTVVGAAACNEEDELVFVSSDSSLLLFPATAVRPQGRAAGGMAGIKLAAGHQVLFFGVAPAARRPELAVVTVAGTSSSLPGMGGGSVKVTPFELYPGKGRATGGVRSQRLLKGEDRLVLAWVGEGPPRGVGPGGQPVDLPPYDHRRDGSGTPLKAPLHAVG